MPDENDVLVASVSELVQNFRSALLAVLPAADRAMLTWADHNQHYDWEKLAQCMFDVFVRSPLSVDRHRAAGEFELAAYDIDVTSYSDTSWIACRPDPDKSLALVRLLTNEQPFDTVQAVEVDSETYVASDRLTIPFAETEFAYVRRRPDGPDSLVMRVEAED